VNADPRAARTLIGDGPSRLASAGTPRTRGRPRIVFFGQTDRARSHKVLAGDAGATP